MGSETLRDEGLISGNELWLCKYRPHPFFKVLKWQRVVTWIKRFLIPLVSELCSQVVCRVTLVFFARVGVHPKVAVIVATLKILVRLDHEVHFRAHIWLQDCCSNGWMIRNTDCLANVVAQGATTTSSSAPARSAMVAVCNACVN